MIYRLNKYLQEIKRPIIEPKLSAAQSSNS